MEQYGTTDKVSKTDLNYSRAEHVLNSAMESLSGPLEARK
jgi:hypothetical protein